MNSTPPPPIPQVADKLFLALGQALYICQLFEGTMLEVLAHAYELLDGTGDGRQFQESIDTLSRKTLGQLLHEFRRRADIRQDIEILLVHGLEARNFVVHHFATHLGDDLTDARAIIAHQRSVYEKCATVMAANDSALALLESIAKLNSARSGTRLEAMDLKISALRVLAAKYAAPRH